MDLVLPVLSRIYAYLTIYLNLIARVLGIYTQRVSETKHVNHTSCMERTF